MTKQTTHFGFEEVPTEEKVNRVQGVFSSVANKYDLMNDLMSLGIHRMWKRQAIAKCDLKAGQTVLDLAGGTGDLTNKIAKIIGKEGLVILADLNSNMLNIGKDRLLNCGILKPVQYLQTNGEAIAADSNSFDCVTIAYGLRNITNKDKALAEIYRVLKPGGRLVILEFSHPINKNFKSIYDFYSFNVLPFLGKMIANDPASYKYLAESIRMHPDQETLLSMLTTAGFENCNYQNLSNGICAIHQGMKF